MSVYVSQYQYDIFVSYADINNNFPEKDKGWVTTFVDTLKNSLAEKIGENSYSLWSKKMLPGNIPSTDYSIQCVENSAVFLLILSPSYLENQNCNLELQAFLAKANSESGRFFVIEYQYVERPEALSDLKGYTFWETDSSNDCTYPLNINSQEYYKKTEKLANEIVKTLKELKLKADTISEVSENLNNFIDSDLNNSLFIWWNQLDDNWKTVFKEAISIKIEPSNNDLEKIVNLQELSCWDNKISDLEPLRALTNLQELNCGSNNISDLEPLRALNHLHKLYCASNKIINLESLRALTNLQELDCGSNKISDLEPLRALTSLQELWCSFNKVSELKPLHTLINLQELDCEGNQISDLELDKFKKSVPDCEVKETW